MGYGLPEVMLQQTRAESVRERYTRWMTQLPNVTALATASLESVLKLWEGLGYYGRAHNLHRAAQLLLVRHGGILPREEKSLRDLPGIGRYTAGAIEPYVDSTTRHSMWGTPVFSGQRGPRLLGSAGL